MTMSLRTSKLTEAFVLLCEKCTCLSIVFIVIPGLFTFELTVVRATYTAVYRPSAATVIANVIISTYLLINISGNIAMSIFTDTTLKKTVCVGENWRYCDLCQLKQPERSWHCIKCNVCIVRRDHHCFFYSRCIGYYNLRFYILSLAYTSISMLYATYFNFYVASSKFGDYEFFISFVTILNPFLRFITAQFLSIRDAYTIFMVCNLGLFVWATFLLTYHFRNIVNGLTAYENSKCKSKDSSRWKDNIVRVFGKKWYLAVVWPFAVSPLVGEELFDEKCK